ncbi:hypothetical protein PF003_g33875 [Phytophthora fragariae]|nr:hypothetical protein PF003_g33875 [Phytophthora fragariae]
MVGKPRHDAEATKLTKKSMKSAAKVVTREQHIGGPATSNETAAPQQPSLTPYERMRQLLAQRDPVAGPVVVDTAEVETELASTIRRVQTMMKKQKTPQTRAANTISAAVISGSTSVHAAALKPAAVFSPRTFRSARKRW